MRAICTNCLSAQTRSMAQRSESFSISTIASAFRAASSISFSLRECLNGSRKNISIKSRGPNWKNPDITFSQHRKVRDKLPGLKGAADSQVGDNIRLETCNRLGLEEDRSAFGYQVAGDTIEQGGFTCAVRDRLYRVPCLPRFRRSHPREPAGLQRTYLFPGSPTRVIHR